MSYRCYYKWPIVRFNLKAWQPCKKCNRYSLVTDDVFFCERCLSYVVSGYDTILDNLRNPDRVKVIEERDDNYLATVGQSWGIINVRTDEDVNWCDIMIRPCEDTVYIDCLVYVNEAAARREWKSLPGSGHPPL